MSKKPLTFTVLALCALIFGNTLAVILTVSAESDITYTAETIMSGLSSPSVYGTALASFASLAFAAGIGDILSIILTSFSISFLPKSSDAPRAPKIFAVAILTVSVLALLSILTTYALLLSCFGV